MTTPLPLSSRLYGRLLVLYPEDLRRDFGTEMALVFADDLAAARREAGFHGVFRVWRCALSEFFRFGLPALTDKPAIRVPAVAFAIAYLGMAGEFTLAMFHKHPGLRYLQELSIVMMLPSLSAFFIAFASVWACRGNTTISLGLTGRRPER